LQTASMGADGSWITELRVPSTEVLCIYLWCQVITWFNGWHWQV